MLQENDEHADKEAVLVQGLRSGNQRSRVFNTAPKRGVVALPPPDNDERKKPKLW